ncbi:TTC28 [Symbiodinium sp. KB8]|nr:TTC28 [Symbiodinium sp. KB8]
MLLQGQIQSSVAPASASATAPPVPASAAELAAVLSSLKSDGSEGGEGPILLRRAAASRQLGEGVEEELRLAEDALDLFRAEGGCLMPSPARATSSTALPSASHNWEASALCAIAEAHLGIEDHQKALEAAEEALSLCRSRSPRSGEAEALVTQFKAQLLTIPAEHMRRIVRELLALWRELGATWGEVADMLESAQRCCAGGMKVDDALAQAADKRESEHRWGLAQDLCTALVAHPALQAKAKLARLLEDLLAASRHCGALTTQDSQVSAAEALLEAGRLDEARRRAARLGEDSSVTSRRDEVRALLVIGRAALALSTRKAGEAFRAGAKAVARSREVGHRRGEADALHFLAKACLETEGIGTPEDALELCSEAGRLYCDLDERRGVSTLLTTLSRAHLACHSPEEALRAARDSLQSLRELETEPGVTSSQDCIVARPFEHIVQEVQALLYCGKAQVALQRGVETARKFLEDALNLLEGLRGSVRQGERLPVAAEDLESEVTLVLVETEMGEPAKAAERAGDARMRFQRNGRKDLEAAALQLLARAHIAQKEPSAGREAAREAIRLRQELNDPKGEKETLQLLVSAELLGNTGSAMQIAKQAVERFKNEGDSRNEALALQTVAKTHIANQEFLRAARISKDAQRILGQLGDTDSEMEMLQTAVEAHLARPEAEGKDDALKVTVEALSEFRRRDNLRGQALTLGLLARVYLQLPDPEAAVHAVRDAVALFRELGDRKSEMLVIRSIINEDLVPESIESADASLRAVKAALAVCHQADDKRGQAVMLKITFRILLARERPERALQAAEEAMKMYREQEDRAGEAQMALQTTKVLVEREEFRKALSAAQSAVILFKEAGDAAGELSALQAAVDAHAARGDHAMVLESSKEVLEKCRLLQDPASEATLLQRVCEVYLEQGGKENAEVVARTAKQAHSLARAAGDLNGETAALAALARSHLAASRPQEAVEVAKEAVRCASESADRRSQITALQAFGSISLKLGHGFDALEASKEAIEYCRFEGLANQEAACLATLVAARLANAEPSEALRAAKEAHDRARRLGNPRAEAASLEAVASVCLHIKAPAEAIQALDGAQLQYKKLKDKKREGAVVGMAVKAQLLAGDATAALRAAKEARALARELRDRKAEAEALDAASQVHLAKRDYNEALDCAKSMASLYDELQEDKLAAKAKQLLTSVYLAKGDARAAIDIGEDAVATFQKLEEPSSEAVAQHLCAQAYLQRHHDDERSRQQNGLGRTSYLSQDPAEAVRSAQRARALFKQLGNLTGELEVMDTLARAHIRKGEAKEGLRVAEDFLAAAKKARDKPAEANALLVSSSALASDGRLSEALRSAEAARSLYRDLGHAEGLQDSERFLGVVRDALKEIGHRVGSHGNGYSANSNVGAPQRGPSKFGFRPAPAEEPKEEKSPGSLITGERRGVANAQVVNPTPLYNRKAFPWTPQQADKVSTPATAKPMTGI